MAWPTARRYSTADLLGILDAEPERISPAALLRPVFQDFLFSTSAQVGGPAEIAYLAQSSVLFERILGRQTPPIARFSATLIEPSIAKMLRRHELTLEQVFAEENAASLAQRLAARSMPIETKQKLAAAGNALDAELDALVGWLQSQDKGLGQSADTAAGKMRYQMNRLRTLAANFQLQRETTLSRHAETIFQALYPGGVLAGAGPRRRVLLRPLRAGAGRNPLRASRQLLPRPHSALAVRTVAIFASGGRWLRPGQRRSHTGTSGRTCWKTGSVHRYLLMVDKAAFGATP